MKPECVVDQVKSCRARQRGTVAVKKCRPRKRSWFAAWFSHASVGFKKADMQSDTLCSYNGMSDPSLGKTLSDTLRTTVPTLNYPFQRHSLCAALRTSIFTEPQDVLGRFGVSGNQLKTKRSSGIVPVKTRRLQTEAQLDRFREHATVQIRLRAAWNFQEHYPNGTDQ